MPHLSRTEIERKLLAGASLTFLDGKGKKAVLQLDTALKRRLFAFVLSSTWRSTSGMPDTFVSGLQTAYDASDDPATVTPVQAAGATSISSWRLQSLETEGFGGLNVWKGPAFRYDFDSTSILLEGPNGSGKSSLTGAIVWALTGERPRDQAPVSADIPKPVFGSGNEALGNWPPIATYPPTVSELKSAVNVRVKLLFRNASGAEAVVERQLTGNGMTSQWDPAFDIPVVIVETGLLMPARLGAIRFDEGRGQLTDAVQKLTGLDDLIDIAALADGLCHKAREYQSYKKKDLASSITQFTAAINEARTELATANVAVPSFVPADTKDPLGPLAQLGKTLTEKSGELTSVVAKDLSTTLDLTSVMTQNQVIAAIAAAKEDVALGLESSNCWKRLLTIGAELKGNAKVLASEAVADAVAALQQAIKLGDEADKDTKFRLKAYAAVWHAQHDHGAINNCPLCEVALPVDSPLPQQLIALHSAGEAATRAFADNVSRIVDDLNSTIPPLLRSFGSEVLSWNPPALICDDIRATFVTKDRYAKTIVGFLGLVSQALSACPKVDLQVIEPPIAEGPKRRLEERIAILRRLIDISEWFEVNSAAWTNWWTVLTTPAGEEGSQASETSSGEKVSEDLSSHLTRLSDALEKAGPYRRAAAKMREAWKQGQIAAQIELELARREAIADNLVPLKDLKTLCETVARETIEGLSSSIADLLKRIHLTEQLKFSDARLDRKEGLIVQGGFTPDLRINATLVANTSWLRAILWAFIFSLRAEAVKQLGADPLPLLVLDDPQATFDVLHRHRWAQYIAFLQSPPSLMQLILATHDENFLNLIKVDGVTGREAFLDAASPEVGHVAILEGDYLSRLWDEAQIAKTPQAGRNFMNAARIHLEGMLKLMLRGETWSIGTTVVGSCRDRINILHKGGQGPAPWNRSEFSNLLSKLNKDLSQIKYMEMAHHSQGTYLGMTEATDVYEHLKKLLPAVETGFRLIRTHQLVHGGLRALYAPPTTLPLPEGYKTKVKSIPLMVLGRAAALTDGKVSDGRFSLDEYQTSSHKKVTLAQHSAFRLTALTLEPVARPGDILLVREDVEVSERSLVIARDITRILARRFAAAEGLSDLAVLTAQAINPYQIAAPIVAQRGTVQMSKIVGVIYDSPHSLKANGNDEICDCGGESAFAFLSANALGLVEVVGRSAEPHALDKQYLIIGKEVLGPEALKTLDGRPIIAGDTEGNRYFKRLRAESADRVVLESLDSGGDFGPVLLSCPGGEGNCLERAWPVAGVIFELPT